MLVPSEIMTEPPERWCVETRKWYVEKEWRIRIHLQNLNLLTDSDIVELNAFIQFHTYKTDLLRAALATLLTQNIQRCRCVALSEPANDLAQFMVLHYEFLLEYSFDLPSYNTVLGTQE